MDKPNEVNRCVCHRRSFEKLQAFAIEEDIDTVDELIERRLCGCGCGMCIPYIKLMLRTGQSSFEPSAIDHTMISYE